MGKNRYMIKDSVNHRGKKMIWDSQAGSSVFDNMTPQDAVEKLASLNRRARYGG
jgi:hypothetical protein